MKRTLAASVAVAMLPLTGMLWSGECIKPPNVSAPIPIFVATTDESGITSPDKDVRDSTKDLISSLKDKHGVCLTENREQAIVILEVLGREKAQATQSWLGRSRDCTVAVKVSYGEHETTISQSAAGGTISSGGAWKKAAGKVAKRIEEWVAENRTKLQP
jgi:hypothetical protein